MNENLVVIISATAIFNLTLITILSWIKATKQPSYLWLGFMFFAACIAILDNISIFTGNGNILLYHSAMLLNISWGAYLILFTNSLRTSKTNNSKYIWVYFIPSFLYLPFIVLCIVSPIWSENTIHLAQQGKMTIIGMLCNMTICLYTVAANIYLIRKEYRIKDSNSKIKELLWVMLSLQLLAFIPFIFRFDLEYIILYMPVFGQIFFLYIFFRMTRSTQLFHETDAPFKMSYGKTTKYAGLKINDEKAEQICIGIQRLMESKKPYLRMEYTLTEMAKELNLLPATLSMILNSKLNSSFPDYINAMRIKTAINLLNDFNKKNLTIETVAYESGFNNRTSFYKAFKKQTGKLPSDYINKRTELKKAVS
ncbi:MAG: helix-turn-helix domain-containing protein [Paludibacter sp.]|nr:helix-turn-helix domain-containing protein [Paludibacter sp.]